MSLLVWLPLNGTLENNGLDNVGVVANGATVNADGKVGSCYAFTSGNTIRINNSSLNINNDEYSVVFWAKCNSNNQIGCMFSQRTAVHDAQRTIFLYGTNRFLFDNGGRWDYTLPSQYVYTQSEWNHFAFTVSNTERRIYINGQLVGTARTTSKPTTVPSTIFVGDSQTTETSTGGNGFAGSINDYRIYDHCLSKREVHELSQALVLHYKLSGMGGGDNLLLGTNEGIAHWGFNLGNRYNQPTKEEVMWLGTRALKATTQPLNETYTNAWTLIYYDDGYIYKVLEPSTQYTISFDSTVKHTSLSILQANAQYSMMSANLSAEERYDENGENIIICMELELLLQNSMGLVNMCTSHLI